MAAVRTIAAIEGAAEPDASHAPDPPAASKTRSLTWSTTRAA